MPKILITGDLHLTENPIERYRHDFVGIILPELIDKHRPDAVVILGDLTEEKDRHSAKLVNQIVSHLTLLSKHQPLAILMGNHDYANQGQAFFEFVRRIRNIHWIGAIRSSDDLKWHHIFPRKPALFLPHTRDYKKDWAKLAAHWKGYDPVFAHNTFDGADAGFKKLEGIPVDIFPKNQLVISGDIHVPQMLKGSAVMYAGAPYTIDFGDAYHSRVLLLNTNSGDVTSISTSQYPQKRLIDLSGFKDGINEAKLADHDVLKIRVQTDTMVGWQDEVRELREWAADRGYDLARIEPVMAAKINRKRVAISAETGSDSEILKEFAKRHGLDKATLDAGLDLL